MVSLKTILVIIFLGSMHPRCLIACDNDEDLNRFAWGCFEHDHKTDCENALITLDVLIKQKESEYFSWNSLNHCRKLRGKIQIRMKDIDKIKLVDNPDLPIMIKKQRKRKEH